MGGDVTTPDAIPPRARALGLLLALAGAAACGDAGVPTATCATGTYWAYGDRGDEWMHPGRPCVGCHAAWRRGPALTVGGTVYARNNQEDECNGFPGNFDGPSGHARVEITDSAGRTLALTANRVGNFHTTEALRFPLRRVVVRWPDGTQKQMAGRAPHGDCNACHTQTGGPTLAGESPGRVARTD